MEAIKRQVLNFETPGTGIPHFALHAKATTHAGIYGLSVHHDAILRPVVLGHRDVAGRQGLAPSAEAARNRLLGIRLVFEAMCARASHATVSATRFQRGQ
jgi:acyl-[acyl-carrier-protein] desaturase